MKRILLADDEESILLAFRKLLGGPDVLVDTADSSEKAECLIGNNRYQAAIVDLRLKGMASLNGLDLVRLVRQSNPAALVIVVSAYTDESINRVVYDSGASFCLEKPVSPKMIRNLLADRGLYIETAT
ncbi:MAG: response regulator [Chitinispirillaceae bacterium]